MNTQFLLLIIILTIPILLMNNKNTSRCRLSKNTNIKNRNSNNSKNNSNDSNDINSNNNSKNNNNDSKNNSNESNDINLNNNSKNNKNNNNDSNNSNDSNDSTHHVELELASNNLNNKNNLVVTNTEAFQNTLNNKSITLFYSETCTHSLNFLKVWHKLIDDRILSDDVKLESIECNSKPEQCKNNNISSVPTLVIQNQSKKHIMNGAQSLDSILEQCKLMGFYVKDPIQEGFVSSMYISGEIASKFIEKRSDEDCPFVSFRQYEDYNRNKNYCVSGDHGQGCVKGISGSKVGNFNAAYSQVGSYLISLPDKSQEKMNKCAALQADSIRNFNLCSQNERLSQISNYAKDVENKKSNPIFLNTDFEDNIKISNAIRYACSKN